ncbi:MAG: S53 family peptidase, partial [Phycisphaerae bacterium]|nr:S53 family peptidase [Phycisphaerae bacterium]
MSKRTRTSGTDRAFSLRQLFQRAAAKLTSRQPADAGLLIEPLEPRTLLSVAPVMTPNFLIHRPTPTMGPAASISPTGLTPSQVRQAYGFKNTMFGSIVGDGTGQTIAIVDAYNDPTIQADLHAFDVTFGLPDTQLTVIGQTGTSALPGTDPAGRGNSWAIETSLDVEWAHAAAPGAKIVLVEARSASTANLFAAVNTARSYAGVSVISLSWGGGEYSGVRTYDSYFTTPSGHNGVTFVVSSGDSGAYGGSSSTTPSVEYPAASPNVVAVGGTYLSTNSSGAYLGETAWGSGTSSYYNGGSGGGISRYETQPAYQAGVVTQTSAYRAVPDVAMLADPSSGVAVIDTWDFGTAAPWLAVGGTSLAAPLWAGVLAIVNQGRAINGLGTLDGKTQTLPMLYSLPSSDFHDIISGSNGYPAGPGYDLVTGRGTPIVNLLAPAMAGMPVTPAKPMPLIGSLSANPASVLAGATVTLTAANVAESS